MDFGKAKELFKDEIDISLYVPLYKKLEIDMMYAINEKEKIVLLYGDAGSGKTFLLNRVFKVLKEKEKEIGSYLYFIHNPKNQEQLLNKLLLLETDNHRVLFIDEAQSLKDDKIETLRFFSDNRNYTIILATHEKKAREIFSKKHFESRINYILQTTPCSYDDMVMFISSKLRDNGFETIDRMFSKSNYKLIYKYTKGNLREINQLIYRAFDIIEYFYNKNPVSIKKDKLDNKFIEMAYMFRKEVHASL